MRSIALLTALAALALPVAAQAGITEYPIEPGAAPGVHAPLYLAPALDGNYLWYTDDGTARAVGRMSTAGEPITPIPLPARPWTVLPVTGGNAYVSLENGIANAHGDGSLFIVDSPKEAWGLTQAPNLHLYFGTTSAASGWQICSSPVCTPAQPIQGRPLGLTRGPDGAVWATVYEANLVLRVPAVPNVSLTVPLPVGSGPDQIAAGSDGNLWVTMFDADAVDRITPAGVRTRFALPAGTAPDGITASPDGALWIAGAGNETILRLNTAGAVTGTWTTPTPRSTPTGIVTGPDGAIWFTEADAGKLGRLVPDAVLAPSGGSGTTPGGGGGAQTAVAPRFVRGPVLGSRRIRAGRALRLTFTLSEASDLRIALTRLARGRRAGTRCVAPTHANRSARSCVRDVVARSLRRRGREGRNALALGTRGLAPGRYHATLTATNAGGLTSRPADAAFTILAARRTTR